MLFTKRALVPVLLTVIFLTTCSVVQGQNYAEPITNNPMAEIGFKKDHVYQKASDFVTVDLVNGNAIVQIPVATIIGKGGESYTLKIQYNSSVVVSIWDKLGQSYMVVSDDPFHGRDDPKWNFVLPRIDRTETGESVGVGGAQVYCSTTLTTEESEQFTMYGDYYTGDPDTENMDYMGDNMILDHVSGAVNTMTGTRYTGLITSNENDGGVFNGWLPPGDFDEGMGESTHEEQITSVGGVPLILSFSKPSDPAYHWGQKLDKVYYKNPSDGAEWRTINIHYAPKTNLVEYVTYPVSGGTATVDFQYEVVGQKTYDGVLKSYNRLKKVTFPDGRTFEFSYYSVDGLKGDGTQDYRENGNAYLSLGVQASGFQDPVLQQCGFPLLKSLYLPTGGRIDLSYQIQGFMESTVQGREATVDEDWGGETEGFVQIVLGVKTVKYFSDRTSETPIETRKYKLIQPYMLENASGTNPWDQTLPLKSITQLADASTELDYSSITPDALNGLIFSSMDAGNIWKMNPSGRRVDILDAASKLISRTDTVYDVGIQSDDRFIKKKYRRTDRVISYEKPEPENDSDWNRRTEIVYENYGEKRYEVGENYKVSNLPPNQKLTYTTDWFPETVSENNYTTDESGNELLTKTSKTTTTYFGLSGDFEHPVIPRSKRKEVKDDHGDILLDHTTTYSYNFVTSFDGVTAWGVDLLAKPYQIVAQEGGKMALKTYHYSETVPWQVDRIDWGAAIESVSPDPEFPEPILVFDDSVPHRCARLEYEPAGSKDESGFSDQYLLKKRSVELLNQNGTLHVPADWPAGKSFQNTIDETFKYTGGITSSYTLGDTTNLHLTTSRIIDSATGIVQSQINPDGSSISYDWDSSNHLTGIHSIGADADHTPLVNTVITYSNYDASNGTPACVTVSGPTTNKFYYDGLGRLIYEGSMTWDGQFDWSKVEYQGLGQERENWTGLRLANGIAPWTGAWGTVARKEKEHDGYGRETKKKIYKLADDTQPESEIDFTYSGFTKTETLKDETGAINRRREFLSNAKGDLKELRIFRTGDNAPTKGWITKATYEYSELFNDLRRIHLKQDDATLSETQDREFNYDASGNLTSTNTPEEGIITYNDYNVFGKPASKSHANKIFSFTYDPLGRETNRVSVETRPNIPGYPLTESIETVWGNTGISTNKITQLTTTLDGNLLTEINYEYDAVTGNPKTRKVSLDTDTSVSGFEVPEKTVAYAYEPNGNLKTLTYPMESISGFSSAVRTLTLGYYSTNSQPRELLFRFSDSTRGYTYPDQPKALVSDLTYEPTGGSTYNTGDTLSNVITNNTLGQLTGITYGNNLLAFSNYAYDARGNITQLHKTGPGADVTNTYTYDDYNRLRTAHYSGTDYSKSIDITESFDYDYAGNMTTKTCNDPIIGNILNFGNKVYNSKNQDPSMTYDTYGNVTQLTVEGKDNPLDLAYTPFSRVKTVTEGTNKYEYTYDGEGKRVVKKIYKNNTELTEIHIYIRGATGKILEELKKIKKPDGTWTDWTWVKDYYYFGDKLISAASAE